MDNVLGWLHEGYPRRCSAEGLLPAAGAAEAVASEEEVVKAAQTVLQGDRLRHGHRGGDPRRDPRGHRQGTQSRGDPPGRRAAGLGRLAAGGTRPLTLTLRRVSRRSGWSSGTCTKISGTPSGSVTCISCRPHGSCRASRAIWYAAVRSAPSRWRTRRAPEATARPETAVHRVRGAVAGEFDQRLAGVEDGARPVVPGDRQADARRGRTPASVDSRPAGTASGWPGSPWICVYHVGFGSADLPSGVCPVRARAASRLSSLPHGLRGSVAAKSTDLGSL